MLGATFKPSFGLSWEEEVPRMDRVSLLLARLVALHKRQWNFPFQNFSLPWVAHLRQALRWRVPESLRQTAAYPQSS